MPEPRGGLPSGVLHDIRSLTSYPPAIRRGWANVKQIPGTVTGQTYFYKVPAEYWTRLLSLIFTFTTSATVAERQFVVAYFQGDGSPFGAIPISQAFGAGLLGQCSAMIDGPALTVVGGQSVPAQGRVLGPAATTVLCSAALTGGQWTVGWQVALDGTVAAADQNNFGLYIGTTLIAQSENPATAGGPWPQETVTVQIPFGGATLAIKSIGAGTGTAGYTGQFSATPYGNVTSYAKLPDITLQPGWSFGIETINGQAGDVLQGITLLVEEYPSDWASGTESREAEELVRELVERSYAG